MNNNIEFKFKKSELWTLNKISFYLKVKNLKYDNIDEQNTYYNVTINDNIEQDTPNNLYSEQFDSTKSYIDEYKCNNKLYNIDELNTANSSNSINSSNSNDSLISNNYD